MVSLVFLAFIAFVGHAACQPNIWRPKPGTSAWQWQLSSTEDDYVVDTSFDVQMYDIDMWEVSAADMKKLKADGRVVICYIDVGSWESDRPDADQFPDIVKANKMDGWPEYWLDISQIDPSGENPTILQQILNQRFITAKNKGCHGIEPDNVDAYDNSVNTVLSIDRNGDPVYGDVITEDQSVAFIKWVASAVHALGMSVGLKNSPGIVERLMDDVDWALNEQCNEYDECDGYANFIASGKSVFNCEYDLNTANFCDKDTDAQIEGILKTLDLDAEPFTQCRSYPSGPVCGDNLCVTGEDCPQDCDNVVSDFSASSSSSSLLPHAFDWALLIVCITGGLLFIAISVMMYRHFIAKGKLNEEASQYAEI